MFDAAIGEFVASAQITIGTHGPVITFTYTDRGAALAGVASKSFERTGVKDFNAYTLSFVDGEATYSHTFTIENYVAYLYATNADQAAIDVMVAMHGYAVAAAAYK